jgi:hypothetical protein
MIALPVSGQQTRMPSISNPPSEEVVAYYYGRKLFSSSLSGEEFTPVAIGNQVVARRTILRRKGCATRPRSRKE